MLKLSFYYHTYPKYEDFYELRYLKYCHFLDLVCQDAMHVCRQLGFCDLGPLFARPNEKLNDYIGHDTVG